MMNSTESRGEGKSTREGQEPTADRNRIPREGFHPMPAGVGGGKIPHRFLIKRQEKGRNRLFGKEGDGFTPRITNGSGGTPCENLNQQRDPVQR